MHFLIAGYVLYGIFFEACVISKMDIAQANRVQGWEIVIETLGWGVSAGVLLITFLMRKDFRDFVLISEKD